MLYIFLFPSQKTSFAVWAYPEKINKRHLLSYKWKNPSQSLFLYCFCHVYCHSLRISQESAKCMYTLPIIIDKISVILYTKISNLFKKAEKKMEKSKKFFICNLAIIFTIVLLLIIIPTLIDALFLSDVQENTENKNFSIYTGKVIDNPVYVNLPGVASSFIKIRVEMKKEYGERKEIDVLITMPIAPQVISDYKSRGKWLGIGKEIYFYVISVNEIHYPSSKLLPQMCNIGIYIPQNIAKQDFTKNIIGTK